MKKYCWRCLLLRWDSTTDAVMCQRCAHDLATLVVYTQWCPVEEAEKIANNGRL